MAVLKIKNSSGVFEDITTINGLSAYQIAVKNGFVGTESEWLASLKGDAGSIASGDAKDLTVTFTESTTRETITSGSTIATLFGKLKKWFTDLKTVAFTGSYNDLSDKPTIPAIPTNVSSFTNDKNYQTDTNVNSLINTHDSSSTAHSDIRTSLSNIQAIAEGKSRARVFATVAALDTWLSDSANTALLQVGDNFYITATDVPDYWWDGTAKQKLETEKVVLSDATTNVSGLMSASDKTRSDYNYGSNAVTTLASLPITKKLVIATLSAATSLSLATDMEVGQELYIRCVPSAAFTQPIPNSGSFVSMSGSSITTVSGTPFEISILCYAAGYYSIVVKTQD